MDEPEFGPRVVIEVLAGGHREDVISFILGPQEKFLRADAPSVGSEGREVSQGRHGQSVLSLSKAGLNVSKGKAAGCVIGV